MSDLQYTLGLDTSAFTGFAAKAISVMGSMELAIGLVSRAAAAMTSSFEKAASMESIETAIGTILKDAKATKAVMSELKTIGAETPFEMSDLAPAARALLGAGTATKDLGRQIRMLGDVAAGADTDLGGLVSIFNQIRGKGTLATEEFLQLAERGVAGLREEIAKFKGINVNEVGDALTKGAVSAKDFESILGRMTGNGGLFFQSMVRQSETFAGKLSTLSDAWSSLQVAFAAPINDALKPILDDLTGLGALIEPVFAAVGEQVATVVSSFREFLLQINEGASGVDALIDSFGGLIGTVGQLAMVPILALAEGLPEIGSGLLTALLPVLEILDAKFTSVAMDFIGSMSSGLAVVLRQLDEALPDFGILSSAAGVFDNIATGLHAGAASEDERAANIKAGSGIDAGQRQIALGMADIMKGFSTYGNAFAEGTLGLSLQDATMPDMTPPPDFFGRLIEAAGPGIAAPFAEAGMQNSPTEIRESLTRLDSILNELQRINSF